MIAVMPEWVELFDLRNERRKDFSKLKGSTIAPVAVL